MQLDELIEIGHVTKPWGIKGEVKIHLTSDIPDRINDLEGVYLHNGESNPLYYTIEWIKHLNKAVAVKFEGINSPEEAAGLRRLEIAVPVDDRATLSEDEFYIYDLVGLDAEDGGGKKLGTLKKVFQGAAQDIFLIATTDGDVMVPVVLEYVHEIDLAGGRIVITLPLLEEQ
jgi:16S rRNA processing protein RimM